MAPYLPLNQPMMVKLLSILEAIVIIKIAESMWRLIDTLYIHQRRDTLSQLKIYLQKRFQAHELKN